MRGENSMFNKPIIGITMGDPFGNGPEITVQAMSDPQLYDRCRPLVVGDLTSMEYALQVSKKLRGTDLKLHPIQKVEDALYEYGTIDLLDLGWFQQILFLILLTWTSQSHLELEQAKLVVKHLSSM